MKLYFALATDLNSNKVLLHYGENNFLASFYYFQKGVRKVFLDDYGIISDDFFLDSGAFSAWNCGKNIDINEYINFIQDNNIKLYANLDAIGDPHESLKNQKIMESNGLMPVPVFHIGEPLEFLDSMINYDYIALGGMVASKNIEEWLDKVFNYIHQRNPYIKIHGFGLTKFHLMLKYPWYSVDSSSWSQSVVHSRLQLWNTHTKRFRTITGEKFFNQGGYPFNKGDKMDTYLRARITNAQVKEFLKMQEDICGNKLGKDYFHITSQQTLF